MTYVTSNMMTTKETVILVTPPRAAAAPTIAYRPGIIQLCQARKFFSKKQARKIRLKIVNRIVKNKISSFSLYDLHKRLTKFHNREMQRSLSG